MYVCIHICVDRGIDFTVNKFATTDKVCFNIIFTDILRIILRPPGSVIFSYKDIYLRKQTQTYTLTHEHTQAYIYLNLFKKYFYERILPYPGFLANQLSF